MSSPPASPEARLHVRVTPRASRTEVVGWRDPVLQVRVAAVPEAGRANRAVAALLAEVLDVPRRAVVLERGGRSRDKRWRIDRLSPAALRARLEALPR